MSENVLPRGVTRYYTRMGIPVLRIHYAADPERNEEWVRKERRKYTSQAAWDAEQEIVFSAGGGELIFRHILNKWADKIIIRDPEYRASPYWKDVGGMDYGQTNPTATVVGKVDDDGCIILLGEYYWAPAGEEEKRSVYAHAEQLKKLPGFMQSREILADPSIFYKNQQQQDGNFKAIADLFHEAGIKNLGPAPENNDLSGVDRILAHWRDLDNREPTLKIWCPEPLNYEKRRYGLYPRGCPNLIWELRNLRRAQLTAQQLLTRNPTEKIVDKNNHAFDACLVAGTLITTQRGPIPIEQIHAGDTVLTRSGWQKVSTAGMTSAEADIFKVRLSDGRELLSTGNHPVWTAERRFLRVDALKYGMLCSCLSTAQQKLLTGWGLTSIGIHTATTAISAGTSVMAAYTYTRSSGYSLIRRPYQISTISTTKTGIPLTMTRRIWKLYQESSISSSVAGGARHLPNSPISQLCARRPRHGIRQMREGHGIPSTVAGNYTTQLQRCARSAGHHSRIETVRRETPSALATAEHGGGTPIDSTSKQDFANCVAKNSNVRNTIKLDFALEYARVVSVERTGLRLPVYNLTVENCPEYFANGILVHNCKYLVLSMPLPNPGVSLEKKWAEFVQRVEAGQQSVTNVMIQRKKLEQETREDRQPVFVGGRAQLRKAQWNAKQKSRNYSKWRG